MMLKKKLKEESQVNELSDFMKKNQKQVSSVETHHTQFSFTPEAETNKKTSEVAVLIMG